MTSQAAIAPATAIPKLSPHSKTAQFPIESELSGQIFLEPL
jgi:hypothetical protein